MAACPCSDQSLAQSAVLAMARRLLCSVHGARIRVLGLVEVAPIAQRFDELCSRQGYLNMEIILP